MDTNSFLENMYRTPAVRLAPGAGADLFRQFIDAINPGPPANHEGDWAYAKTGVPGWAQRTASMEMGNKDLPPPAAMATIPAPPPPPVAPDPSMVAGAMPPPGLPPPGLPPVAGAPNGYQAPMPSSDPYAGDSLQPSDSQTPSWATDTGSDPTMGLIQHLVGAVFPNLAPKKSGAAAVGGAGNDTLRPGAAKEAQAYDENKKFFDDMAAERIANKAEDKKLAMMKFFSGMIGAGSPFFLQNVGAGAKGATDLMQQQSIARRKEDSSDTAEELKYNVEKADRAIKQQHEDTYSSIARAKNTSADAAMIRANNPPGQGRAQQLRWASNVLRPENSDVYTDEEKLSAHKLYDQTIGGSTTGNAPKIYDLPSDASQARVGVIYNTQHGPAIWNGKNFVGQ